MAKHRAVVWIYVDPYGSQLLDTTPDDEYPEIEAMIRDAHPGVAFRFVRNKPPTDLLSGRCDVYVFDIGGLCYTDYSGSTRLNFCRVVQRAVEDLPDTLFVPWTGMTRDYLRSAWHDLVETRIGHQVEEGELPDQPANVCLPPSQDRWALASEYVSLKLKEWFPDAPPKPDQQGGDAAG